MNTNLLLNDIFDRQEQIDGKRSDEKMRQFHENQMCVEDLLQVQQQQEPRPVKLEPQHQMINFETVKTTFSSSL
jgi:hypothetical protein